MCIVSGKGIYRNALFAKTKFAQKRDINLEEVLKYELSGIPPALFNDDGSLRKTTKADLAKKLEEACPSQSTLPPNASTAYIIDGMALLQSLTESLFTTFADVCKIR